MTTPLMLLCLVRDDEQQQVHTAVAAVALVPALLAKTTGGQSVSVDKKVIFAFLAFQARNAKINLIKPLQSVHVINLKRLMAKKITFRSRKRNHMLMC